MTALRNARAGSRTCENLTGCFVVVSCASLRAIGSDCATHSSNSLASGFSTREFRRIQRRFKKPQIIGDGDRRGHRNPFVESFGPEFRHSKAAGRGGRVGEKTSV